ncbi:Serine palmitoyltransferase 1 [Ceratocystis fimbriata CBS 114723]|uniref:serine C-palmitoyltransferase n=1 Tax=Ceratocystis fimbriata CBS 114723 TaxID=1035309 RepID=A0A2C5XME4_9PEZI|nr:Serine palmitoyltransferase 1 [Ceratocystis fimbriata CBS 114723]
MEISEVQAILETVQREAALIFQKIPGSAVLIRYIKSSYQDDPVRSALELVLVLFVIRYMMAPSYSTQQKNHVKLSDAEIDELVDDWTPEPLVASQSILDQRVTQTAPVIAGPSGPKSKLTTGKTVTNLGSFNFYNLNANEVIKEKAIEVLRAYGVGPCGPPQFYGTQDVHVKTEADIAAYIGTEASILYAQAFSTISSVIPAFCKRGDIIVADSAVNYSIRRGLQISRSNIRWFKHGDMDDLEKVMKQVVKEQAKRKPTRRFIVTEGLFETTGDSAYLPKLIELKLKYKFRIILDETWSFGVLGKTGRGLTEAQNVDPTQVDMIVGSMAGPLCAGGGFCAGTKTVVDHQRITAASYTFSAALPAMLAVTASESISQIKSNPDLIAECRKNIRIIRAQIEGRNEYVTCTSNIENPVILIIFKPEVVRNRHLSEDEQERLLQAVVEECLSNGVLVTRLRRMPGWTHIEAKNFTWDVQPALKVCTTIGLDKKEVEAAGQVIQSAIVKVMNRDSLMP